MNNGRTIHSLAVIFAIVVICHLGAVILNYGYNDDYHVLYDSLTGQFSASNHVLTRDGRYLTAAFVEIAFGLAQGVDHLKYIRAFGIVFSATAAVVFFLILRKAGYNKIFSVSLSVVTFTTPAFSVYSSWTICFPYPVGALTGMIAGALIYNAGHFQETSASKRCLLFAAGISMTVLCYWIYQPIAFFALLSFAILSWRHLKEFDRQFGKIFAILLVFLVSAVLYIQLNKVLLNILDLSQSGRSDWVEDYSDRFSYISTHTLPAAASGWISVFGFPAAHFASSLILLIILAGLLKRGVRFFLVASVTGVMMLAVSIATFSVQKEAYLAYRLYPGTTAWVLFLLWDSLYVLGWKNHLAKRTRPLMTLNLVAVGLTTCWIVAAISIPLVYLQMISAGEYEAVKVSVREDIDSTPEELDVILPAPYQRTMKEVFWAEFKTRSSHMPWVAPKMITLAAHEVYPPAILKTNLDHNQEPIVLYYASRAGVIANRPQIDVFSRVHENSWIWTIHPLFGNCRKVKHLEFYHSPAFGVFDNNEYPYVYHLGLGWIFANRPDESIAQLLEHRNLECRLDAETFPIIKPIHEPPLVYDPFIGYRARLLQVSN